VTIATIVGARPQFIKAFAVSRVLRPECDEVLVHTDQHYDEELSNIFFEELGIPEPDYNLGVKSKSHGRQTAAMIEGIESVVDEVDPNVVLLYGDTNSTLAGAIVGAKKDTAVAHVEAGLRSFNRDMPEEINRILTDHVSDLLFAPIERAVSNLAAENITDGVYETGDVMYDTLLWAQERATEQSSIVEDLGIPPNEYVLATVHRPKNTDDPAKLESIIDGLARSTLPVVFPAHPRTVNKLNQYGLLEHAKAEFRFIDPVGYLDFVRLLDTAERVATDSGGVQKEAFFLDTPCLTLRNETEWVETVECGWNKLVNADAETIAQSLREERPLKNKPNLYGNGTAAETIVEVLKDVQ